MANTPELRTLIQCTPQLKDAVQDDLDSLSGELLAAKLISSDNDSYLRNPYVGAANRAADLVAYVRTRVTLDASNYHVFIEVLKRREADHKAILKILAEGYQTLAHAPHRAQSVPTLVSETNEHTLPMQRSMSTSDYIEDDAVTNWLKSKGIDCKKDHCTLRANGVNPQCLPLLDQKAINEISAQLSLGGRVIFIKMCKESSCDGESTLMRTDSSSPCFAANVTTNGQNRPCQNIDQPLEMQEHFMVSQFLQEVPDSSLTMLGEALGLSYSKVLRMKNLSDELVAAWLRREDNVTSLGKPITLRTLAEALKRIGQTGIALNILGQD